MKNENLASLSLIQWIQFIDYSRVIPKGQENLPPEAAIFASKYKYLAPLWKRRRKQVKRRLKCQLPCHFELSYHTEYLPCTQPPIPKGQENLPPEAAIFSSKYKYLAPLWKRRRKQVKRRLKSQLLWLLLGGVRIRREGEGGTVIAFPTERKLGSSNKI